jgi:copper chaperone CopZ
MEDDMEMQPVTLVTIIAESALQTSLCKLVLNVGAVGYTVTPCIGSGSRGVRRGLIDVDMNVKVEILTRPEVEYDESRITDEQIRAEVRRLGYEVTEISSNNK